MKPTCEPCWENTGIERPAEYLGPQSIDGGKTIDRWVLICRDHHSTWWDASDWVGRTHRLVDPGNCGASEGGGAEPKQRVIVVVEGGIADWASKPDEVDVDIFDFDGLGWLSRDQQYELMAQLEKGNSESAELALHLTDLHNWAEYPTDLPALDTLHAELHEQTECDHEHEQESTV